jgi:uncharacterized protein (TIGR00106 family)
MLLIELSMSPMDKGPSVSKWVARSLEIIDRSGLDYRLGPMGTCIEGEWDEVMAVVKGAVDAVAGASPRVSLVLKADIRAGFTGELEAKVARIDDLLAGG